MPASSGRCLAAIFLLSLLPAVSGHAQTAGTEIISDQALEKADIATLQAETQLLDTIRQGMVLSIALCEPEQPCAPLINREELQRIITKVTQRIGLLTARHLQSSDPTLEPVMLAYADVRDNFTKMLEQLSTLVPAESAAEGGVDFEEVFGDVDEMLDDESTGEDDFEAGVPQ